MYNFRAISVGKNFCKPFSHLRELGVAVLNGVPEGIHTLPGSLGEVPLNRK